MSVEHLRNVQGASLLEGLIWVVLLGVGGSMAFSSVTGSGEDGRDGRDRHNAHVVVKVFEAGRECGVSFAGATKRDVLASVVEGAWATRGLQAGTFFGLPEMSPGEQEGAAEFLDYRHGRLELRRTRDVAGAP